MKDKKYGYGGRKKNMKRNTSSDAWGDNLPAMKKSKGGQKKHINRNKKSSRNRARAKR